MVRSLALVTGGMATIAIGFMVAGLFVDDPAVFVLRKFADLINWLRFWN